MRYSDIYKCDCINGIGWGVTLFVQGCPFHRHCKGCFNPETWDFNGGKEFTANEENIILNLLNKPYMTRFSILGGSPLAKQNRVDVLNLIRTVVRQYPEIKIWIWTGYTWEELQEQINQGDDNLRDILSMIDILVDGRFVQEQKDLTLKWRGSRNQRVIDVQESLKQHKVILYCD